MKEEEKRCILANLKLYLTLLEKALKFSFTLLRVYYFVIYQNFFHILRSRIATYIIEMHDSIN